MALTLRLTKGTALTYPELDGNFTYLSSSLSLGLATLSSSISAVASSIPTGFTLQSVLDTGNTTATNIRLIGGSIILDTLASSVLYYQDTNTGNSLTVTVPGLTGANVLTLPNANGTLVASINGYTPDSSGSVTIPTGSFTGSYTGSFTGSLLGTASFAITASYALNAGAAINVGSFVTTSSFNTFTGSYNTGSFTGSFIGNLTGVASSASRATSAATADSVTLIQGPGITINGLAITASVRSVNGVLPTNGNIATTLTAVTTGTSASLQVSSSGAITSSLSNGLVWIIANNTPDTTKNGNAYIFVSGAVGQWYILSGYDTSVYDSRYLQLAGGTMAGNITMGSSYTLIGTSSWAASASNAINSQTASFLPLGTYQITSSWATKATNATFATLAVTQNASNNQDYSLVFAPSGTNGYLQTYTDSTSDLLYNPSTNKLTVPIISASSGITGSLFGSASYALTASYALNVSTAPISVIATGSVSASVNVGTGSFQIASGSSTFLTILNSGLTGINTPIPSASLHVKGLGSTSASYAILTTNSNNSSSFAVLDNGTVTNPGLIQASSQGRNEIFGFYAFSQSLAQGGWNTVLGAYAMGDIAATRLSTAIGFRAMGYITSSIVTGSTAVGYLALAYQDGGLYNTAIGYASMIGTTTIRSSGDRNTAIGGNTLGRNTIGTRNNAIGESAMAFNAVGGYNTANGNRALYTNVSSSYNTAMGYDSLYSLVGTGNDYNTAIGALAGRNLTTGVANTILGANINLPSTATSNAVAIGDGGGNIRIYVPSTGNAIIGSTTDNGFKLDINGTTRSQGKLTVSTGGATIVGDTDITGSLNITGSINLSGSINNTLSIVSGQAIMSSSNASPLVIFEPTYGKPILALRSGSYNSNNNTSQFIVYGKEAADVILETNPGGSGSILLGYNSGYARISGDGLLKSKTNTGWQIENDTSGLPVYVQRTLAGGSGQLFVVRNFSTTSNIFTVGTEGVIVDRPSNGLVVTGSIISTGGFIGTASLATTSSYVKLLQGTNITINYTTDGISISSSAAGGSGGSGATDIAAANSTQIQLKSGSLFIGNALTVPFATTSTTASYVNGNIFTSTNIATSASYALTASYVLNSVTNTSGLVTTSSFNSYTSSVTSQFAGTSSFASTASFVTSSRVFGPSGANSILTSSFAITSSYALNGGTSPIVIEVVIGGAPYVIQGGSATVTGLTNGSTTVTSTDFGNRIVEVFRGGSLQPGIDLGDGSAYVTKTLASNSITMSVALATDEYIKIKCL